MSNTCSTLTSVLLNTFARVTLCVAARVLGFTLAFSLIKAIPGCQGKASSAVVWAALGLFCVDSKSSLQAENMPIASVMQAASAYMFLNFFIEWDV